MSSGEILLWSGLVCVPGQSMHIQIENAYLALVLSGEGQGAGVNKSSQMANSSGLASSPIPAPNMLELRFEGPAVGWFSWAMPLE